jgi:hypothetical protein
MAAFLRDRQLSHQGYFRSVEGLPDFLAENPRFIFALSGIRQLAKKRARPRVWPLNLSIEG